MQGTVLAGTNNVFEVECEDQITRSCTIKGKVLKQEKEYYNPLAPGDCVEIEKDEIDEEKGQIISLLPRKNEFVRWNVKGRCPQHQQNRRLDQDSLTENLRRRKCSALNP